MFCRGSRVKPGMTGLVRIGFTSVGQPNAEDAETTQKTQKIPKNFFGFLLRLLRNFCALCVRLSDFSLQEPSDLFVTSGVNRCRLKSQELAFGGGTPRLPDQDGGDRCSEIKEERAARGERGTFAESVTPVLMRARATAANALSPRGRRHRPQIPAAVRHLRQNNRLLPSRL